MGHSYCSGPIVLSEDFKSYHFAPTTKKNLHLRSPGCPRNANGVEVREFYDNGLQRDIREFLQQEQPPPESTPALSRTNSKRKKQILNMLFKPRHRSSRPPICHPSPPPSVAKDRMTIEGRKYSQIGLDDKQMYEVGNSSTYQINCRKQPASSTTGDTSNSNMTEQPVVFIEKSADPAPQLDIVNDYDIDISKEWPPELLGGGETELPQEAETETRSRISYPPSSTLKSGPGPRVRDFASSRLRTPSDTQSSSVVKQQSPVLKVPHDAPSWTHRHVSPTHTSCTLNVNGTQASILENSDLVPIRSQVRLHASPPKTPRRSRQKYSLEMAVSPMLGGHSKTPSMLSGNESTIDDGQSDAESAIVLEAQSAEVIQAQAAAGYYNGSIKPPKPGPAPTRALPSLPEVRDGGTTVQRGSTDSAQDRISLESGPGNSPKKIPPKSPARRYGYLPPSTVASRGLSSSPRKDIGSGSKQEPSQIPTMEEPKSSSPLLPPNDLLLQPMSAIGLEQRQNHRTRSTKALKFRDLERLKARRSATSPAVLPDAKPIDQQEDTHETIFLPSTRYSTNPPKLSKVYSFTKLSTETPQQVEKSKPTNDLSPIILIAEQEPTLTPTPLAQDSQHTTSGTNAAFPSQPPNSPASLPLHFPLPPLPSISEPQQPPSSIPTDHSAFDPLTHRISMSHADLEARLEARISALEKKNTLLEKAFLAVLNTSASFSAVQTPMPSGGDRSSGGSGVYGWEAMFRGMQGGRMSTGSGGASGGFV